MTTQEIDSIRKELLQKSNELVSCIYRDELEAAQILYEQLCRVVDSASEVLSEQE